MEVEEKKARPSIYEYEDYRSYLNGLYLFYKETTHYFSYRCFSNRAGFKSPNFLKLVIDGQRNLTEESIEKVGRAFKFSKTEYEYFKYLVLFCQSSKMIEKSRLAKFMAKLRVRQKSYSIQEAQLKYYANWYYIPLRELIGTAGFVEDLSWIESQFNGEIREERIQEAIEDLLLIGLIERDSSGRLRQVDKHIRTSGNLLSSLVFDYHQRMISKGAQSIEDYAPQHREISSTCFPCTEQQVAGIKEMLIDFRQEVIAYTEQNQQADKIYQLNFQFFPVTGVSKRGKL